MESQLLPLNEIQQPFNTIDQEYRTSPLPDITTTTLQNEDSQRPTENENLKTEESAKPPKMITTITRVNSSATLTKPSPKNDGLRNNVHMLGTSKT